MKQLLLTIDAGKRLLGKAIAVHPEIRKKLSAGTIVIIAGTTNGYIAEELLATIGETRPFTRGRFFRGITIHPDNPVNEHGRLPDESDFPGDVIIRNGVWLHGKTIEDVEADLKEGDIVLKGANALDLANKRAAVLIGNPNGGTIIPVLRALIGRRIRLIIPVGLEKRIPGNLDELAARINAPEAGGLRLMPLPGEVFTEIDALALLASIKSELFAAGGVCGAEGSIRLLIHGTPDAEAVVMNLVNSLSSESFFIMEQ